MQLSIAWIGKTRSPAIQALSDDYLQRLSRYIPVEPAELAGEAALLKAAAKRGRVPPALVLLDQRGKQLSSEELAALLRRHQERGTQWLQFAVGPADGFSDAARRRASLLLSLGPMTLPHELARVILLEQLYRAFTILKGHPYHTGH